MAPKPLSRLRGQYWSDNFDPFRKISIHPVRRSDEEFTRERFVISVREVKDPGVFKKAANDGTHCDRFGDALHAGAKAAETSHDKIDWNARLRGFAQRLDNIRVLQLVHLRCDPAGPIGAPVFSFTSQRETIT
jgi:hypothetical protein